MPSRDRTGTYEDHRDSGSGLPRPESRGGLAALALGTAPGTGYQRRPVGGRPFEPGCYWNREVNAAADLFHEAQKEKDQLENQDEHDHELEELTARNRDLLDNGLVDVVERLHLFLDVLFPSRQPEADRDHRAQDPKRVGHGTEVAS